jgi:signal transduction histidine kinase
MSAWFYAGRVGMRAVAVAAALILGGAGLASALLPQMQFAHHGMLLHVALETAASLIALLACFLVFGRLRRHGGVNDLLLACGLALFVLVNVCLLAMSALAQSFWLDLLVWVLLIGRSLGAVLFTLAAFAPARRRLRRPGLTLAISMAESVFVLSAAAIFCGCAAGLAHRIAAVLTADSPRGPDLGGYPALLFLQLMTAALYCAAAIGFFRRSRRFGDEFLAWLALAGALAALSHLNYSFYPFPYVQTVHTGDVFRLCFYTALLIGSMREISSYWYAMSEAAVLEERQRIACELHDGVAQELAYLARHLDSRSREPGQDDLGRLRQAVERAQLESRRVVGTLAAPRVKPVDIALAEAAAEVAERFQLGLRLDLAVGIKASAERADALVRIACEAVTNAARHSGAAEVNLRLERDGARLRLQVTDQGRGFDPAGASTGFGLVSMRHRAHSVGGELRVSSTPGAGSVVEAAL